MGIILETARKKIEGKKPTDRVHLRLRLREVHLLPDEVRRLVRELGGTRLVMTSHLASVEVAVDQVEAVASLPSVIDVG